MVCGRSESESIIIWAKKTEVLYNFINRNDNEIFFGRMLKRINRMRANKSHLNTNNQVSISNSTTTHNMFAWVYCSFSSSSKVQLIELLNQTQANV